MEQNVYAAPDSAINKNSDLTPRFSLAVRMVIRIFAALSALLTLVAIAQFVAGVAKMNDWLAQSLWVTAAQKGEIVGRDIVAPLTIAATLGALSWMLLKLNRQTSSAHMSDSMQMSRSRKLSLGALKLLTFAFAVLAVGFAVDMALGAIAITGARGDAIDHSLLRLGYIHELHFWLPVGSLLVCASCAEACRRLKRKLMKNGVV